MKLETELGVRICRSEDKRSWMIIGKLADAEIAKFRLTEYFKNPSPKVETIHIDSLIFGIKEKLSEIEMLHSVKIKAKDYQILIFGN
jgi:hypothetical protein